MYQQCVQSFSFTSQITTLCMQACSGIKEPVVPVCQQITQKESFMTTLTCDSYNANLSTYLILLSP